MAHLAQARALLREALHRADPKKVDVLGVFVDATNLKDATSQILRWIVEKRRSYVCVTSVHGVMESQRQPDLKIIHNRAGLVTPDGMPLAYLTRATGQAGCGRVYGPDLMLEVCHNSLTNGYRHYFFGTTPETLLRLTDRLARRFPGLAISGMQAPPFRAMTEIERAETIARINAAAPDIVWVGLSTPKQERWMAENRPFLEAAVLIGVGAAFDFHSGTVPQAPAWMQSLCLEWLFRMLVEPKRLWRRYTLNNPQFIFLLALQRLGLRK